MGSDPAVVATAQGLGLRTVRQRLELFSEGSAAFHVQSHEVVDVPYRCRFRRIRANTMSLWKRSKEWHSDDPHRRCGGRTSRA